MRVCFQPSPDERFVDALELLKSLYHANKLDMSVYNAFERWGKEELIIEHRVSTEGAGHAGTWCGFSLYVPGTKAALERYKAYPIYRQTRLGDPMARMTQ